MDMMIMSQKQMKNSLLTAHNPSLVWCGMFIQELLLLYWPVSALPVWQGQARVE